MFNNLGRLDADPIDITRRNADNNRYSNYVLTAGTYNAGNDGADHIKFATNQPSVMFSGGSGVNSNVIDANSSLLIQTQQSRNLAKLQLNQRPFITVPYLGRGLGNPELESRMLQGEKQFEVKSVSSVSEITTLDYALQPKDKYMQEMINNPKYTIEENALNGWTRGGSTARA